MSNETLTSEGSNVTRTTNISGRPSKVLEWDIPDSVIYAIREGEPIILEVEDTAGNNIPNETKFALGFAEPNEVLDVPEFFAEFDVAPFNALSIRDQQSGDNAQRRVLEFEEDVAPEGVVGVEEGDTLQLWVDADADIDVDNLYFEYEIEVRSR